MTSPDDSDGWAFIAKVAERSGLLTGKSRYQEQVLLGLMHCEAEMDYERRANDLQYLTESFFGIVRPEDYDAYRKNKELIRREEGVDEVVYHGESEEVYEDLKKNWGIDMQAIQDALMGEGGEP